MYNSVSLLRWINGHVDIGVRKIDGKSFTVQFDGGDHLVARLSDGTLCAETEVCFDPDGTVSETRCNQLIEFYSACSKHMND